MTHKTIVVSALMLLIFAGGALAAGSAADPAEVRALGLVTITAADAISAVESSSGGKVAELVLQNRNGKPAYQISVIKSDGSELTFVVDGRSGAVTPAADTQDTATADAPAADATETGESANDQDSGNEDAN